MVVEAISIFDPFLVVRQVWELSQYRPLLSAFEKESKWGSFMDDKVEGIN